MDEVDEGQLLDPMDGGNDGSDSQDDQAEMMDQFDANPDGLDGAYRPMPSPRSKMAPPRNTIPQELSMFYKQQDVSSHIVNESAVTLFTTETTASPLIAGFQRRMIHLLDSKRVAFSLVYIDRHPEKQAEMESSGMQVEGLPLLRVGKRWMSLQMMQDLEDSGTLNKVFAAAGVVIVPRRGINGHFRGVMAAASTKDSSVAVSDGLRAQFTGAFVHVSWDVRHLEEYIQADDEAFWLLAMNNEPVYVGADTEYLVSHPPTQSHTFTLHRMTLVSVATQGGISVPTVSRPLSSVTVGIPEIRDNLLTLKILQHGVELSWPSGSAVLPSGACWFVTMDDYEIYRGHAIQHSETRAPVGMHTFRLKAIDSESGDDLHLQQYHEPGVIKVRIAKARPNISGQLLGSMQRTSSVEGEWLAKAMIASSDEKRQKLINLKNRKSRHNSSSKWGFRSHKQEGSGLTSIAGARNITTKGKATRPSHEDLSEMVDDMGLFKSLDLES